ncbi:MAG TPA: 6-phosphofructokinase, partial [Myxococcales bacterium]|nr:6-phosphofructokinase [Myxococcales bacterium]
MPNQIKRIGMLTGGGDCPGLNAVIRAITRAALSGGMEVVGIEDGYLGLIQNRMRGLSWTDVSNLLTQGGTILGASNRANPSAYLVPENGTWVAKDVRDEVMRHVQKQRLDALVVIGGDGTMAGAAQMMERGCCIV